MKKLAMLVVALVVGIVSSALAFTTPDGVFSVTLPEGQVQTTDLDNGGHVWRVVDQNNTEAVGMMETFVPNGTPGQLNAFRDAVLASAANSRLLSDVDGSWSGFGHAKTFSYAWNNNIGTLVVSTLRIWESNTGHTYYTAMVVQASNYQNQSRVESFLDSATFDKSRMQ